MFSKLKEFFQGDKLQIDPASGASERDIQLATAVLLLEMAGSDDDYAPEEVQTVFAVMQQRFKLDENSVMELLELADSMRGGKERVAEFVNALNQHMSPKQRLQVLSMIWNVVYADGKVDKFEQRYAAQLKSRLQLDDEQAEQAKRNGESGKI